MDNSNSLNYHKTEYKNFGLIPKKIHLWEVDGFVKLSHDCRKNLRTLIKKYGVKKLSEKLDFDCETIYSIYSKGRKKGYHSIKHLLDIATILNYDLYTLEKEITAFGRTQIHMYNFVFPFVLTPLHFRAISIHGDGNFNKLTTQSTWYQKHENIFYMEKLLQSLFKSKDIKAYKKDETVSSVTIPSVLVYLTCKSLDLKLKGFSSIQFFNKICELPKEFQFQFFCQFIIDEGHFKDTTFTISQKKQMTRRGLIMLLDSLEFIHSTPNNNKDDITVYGFNYSKILGYLNRSTDKYGFLAGFWFKEEEFRKICKINNEKLSKNLVENRKINEKILEVLKTEKTIFTYNDVRKFGRTSSQVTKAIRNWKKNGFVERIGWGKYRLLKHKIE